MNFYISYAEYLIWMGFIFLYLDNALFLNDYFVFAIAIAALGGYKKSEIF